MDVIMFAIKEDWLFLLPIVFCSILAVGVIINRLSYYSANKRDVIQFLQRLQKELQKNNLDAAQSLSAQLGGIIGEVSEEGIRVLSVQKKGFEKSFDISTSLAVRKLEKHLTILGTIGGVAPFLGLFATVVRILFTFGDLANQGNQSAAVALGIGSALIATAFGLGVAIIAVVSYNSFQSVVRRYEDDFQLIKLLFLSFTDKDMDEQQIPEPILRQPQQAIQGAYIPKI